MQTTQKFRSVEEYIAAQSPDKRAGLKQLRQAIRKAAPGAEEVISYGMPAFKKHGMLVWYAAYNNHYGLYPYPKTLEAFKNELKAYKHGKGTVQFPLDKPIPAMLVTAIVKFRLKENMKKESLKKLTAKRKKNNQAVNRASVII